MTAPSITRQNVLTVGALIERQIGRTQIRLQRATANAWTVEVHTGVQRIADQCNSFADEVEAALTASAYYQLALAEQAVETVDHAAALKPGETRIYTVGDREVRVFETPAGGYLIQVRRDGAMVTDLCRHEAHEIRALNYFTRLVTSTEVAA